MSDSDTTASFTIDLALEGTADTKEARATIEQLRESIARAEDSSKRMALAYRNLKKGGLENTQAAKELKVRLAEAKKQIGTNTESLLKMRGGLGLAGKETEKLGKLSKVTMGNMRGLIAGVELGGGPLAEMGSKASFLTSALGRAGMAGAAIAAVAAVVALDAAIVKQTYDLAKSAVMAADAYRSENLALQGMTKAWVGWWGQVKAGNPDQIQKGIDRVSASVAVGRDVVLKHAESLYRSRLRGDALTLSLKAVAMAEGAAGSEAGDLAKNQIIMNAMWGRSVDGVANRIISRYKAINDAKLLALPVQVAKAKENFAALFRGINIDPILRGLKNVLGVLDQGSVEFKAWKQIFESLFNPLFAGAEEGGNVLRKFADKATMLALNTMIAWEQMRGSFSAKRWGLEGTAGALMKVVNVSTSLLVGLLRGTQAAIALGDVLGSLAGLAINAGLAIKNVFTGQWGKALDKSVEGMGRHAVNLFGGGSEGAKSAGNMIDGLIAGIEAAQPKLNQAVIEAAKESNTAFKNAQDMHSPSRLWTGFGFNMGTSAELGVRRAIPRFAAATTALARVPSAQPHSVGFPVNPQPRMPMGGGGRVEIPLHLHNVPAGATTATINIAEFRTMLAQVTEGLALQMGAT